MTIITTPLPSPFDTSLGSNFTSQSCPDFFAAFLGNATFRSCVPISLLLQNSNSFFRAERNVNLLTETLNAACGAPLALCSPLMASIASELISSDNCGDDYRLQNPLVMQAYAGLMAYEPLFKATCLADPSTGNYCFAEAITNTSNPSDAYPYYTALGIMLPAATRPTCHACLQETMAIFADYAGDSQQPLATTYVPCAEQIDIACGPTFVTTRITVATSGAAPASLWASSPTLAALLTVLCSSIAAAVMQAL